MQRKHLVRAVLILAIAALPLLAMLLISSPASAQRALPPANVVDEQLNLGERPAALPAPEASGPANTLTVDGMCPDLSPVDGTCDDLPLRYKTIQAGINAAAGGDIISVLAGTYVENIVVNKSVELSGAGAGSTTILPAVSLPNPCIGSSMCGSITASSNIIVIQANNVKIHGFTLDGDNPSLTSGIVVNGADLDARNGIIEDFYSGIFNGLEVYDTTIENIYLRGIYASSGGSGFNIYNNIVDNVMADTSSIALFNFGGSGQFAGNTVSRANDAIAANHSKGTQFLNNIVTTSGSGIHTDNAGDGGGTADLIQGNTVSACTAGGYGVWVFVPYIAPTFDANTIADCEVGLSAWGQGAVVTPQFTNNVVDGPASAAGSVGVYVTTDWISWGYSDISVSFSGNVITDYETGLYFTADEQTWNPGPYVEKTITAAFLDNSIAGNTNGAAMGVDGIYNIDASGNWWGSNVPATVAVTVGAGIDYTPWLDSGSDTDVAAGFQGDFATLWVDDDSPQTGAVGRIQEGIDLVTGSTVNVAAGTYSESIAVEFDDLTLLGPNAGIDPSGATPRNAEAVILPTEWYGIYVEAQDVTIDGFTIDGQATTDYGIYAYTGTGKGGLLLTNNIVKNVVDYGFLGWVQSGAPSSDNLVTKNLFDSIQGRSIVALWNYYADVVNNVVKNTAVGIYAENANQPESTGTVEWKENTISATRAGIWYNLVYGTATALTISDNVIDVEDNPAGTRWDGIWLTSLGGSVNPTISGNVITGDDVTQLTIGYHMWNNTTTATDGIVVQGGSVTDVDYGVWINNWDGYPTVGGSNAQRSTAKLNQVTIDGAAIAGVYLKDNPSNTSGATAYVYANVQDSTITNSGIGILVDGEDASVKANSNGIFDNTQGMVNNNAATTMDAENNWWGTACSPASLISGNVDYTPWWGDPTGSFSLSATATTIYPGDSAAQQMAVINCAAPGTTVTYPTPAGSFPGGIIVTANDVTIDLSGSTIGFGSPAYTIVGDDVTLTNGILDGAGEPSPASPGVLVQAGADNFILDNVEVKNWADGVQVAGSVTSFKLVNNWIHSNTDAGLQVDLGVTIGGIVTIEGNLFKVNGGNGVQNDSGNALNATYNSWGADDGPTPNGDGVSANVTYDPWTFAEVYLDVDGGVLGTAGDQYVRNVDESTSFDVDLNVDGQNLYGLSFKFTYNPAFLTFNGPPTFAAPWAGNCEVVGTPPAGTFAYNCYLISGPAWTGGTVATFNFTANGPSLTGNGSWPTYFDISHLEADTNAGAAGGVKVFVNNAGFNDPSVPDRNITDANDGRIDITGIAQFTGFVDLQGRPNDSGALVEVFDGAIVKATATTASSGRYTTSYVGAFLLAIGSPYDVRADRALYLPATRTGNLDMRPLTTLSTVVLLGGDATDDDIVNSFDLTCIGGDYLGAPAVCSAPTSSSDVNGDGAVNILDLTLAGGNFYKNSSPWTP